MMAACACHILVSRQDWIPEQQLAQRRLFGAERIIRWRFRGLRQRGENSLTLPFHSRIQEQKGSRDCPQDKSRWPFHNRASPALQSSTWLRPLGRIMVSGLLEMQERRNGAGGEHRIGNEMVGEFRGQRLM